MRSLSSLIFKIKDIKFILTNESEYDRLVTSNCRMSRFMLLAHLQRLVCLVEEQGRVTKQDEMYPNLLLPKTTNELFRLNC